MTPLMGQSLSGDEKLAGTPPAWSPVGALTPSTNPYTTIAGGGIGPTFVNWTDFLTHYNFVPPYPGDPSFPL